VGNEEGEISWRPSWLDNIKTCTELRLEKAIREEAVQNKWRRMADDAANPWITDD